MFNFKRQFRVTLAQVLSQYRAARIELNATRCVVVLWSKTSVQKHWARVEAGEGLERRILVPAFIDDVRPPLAFRPIQAEHLIDWSGDSLHPGFNRLFAAVSERLRA